MDQQLIAIVIFNPLDVQIYCVALSHIGIEKRMLNTLSIMH